MQNAEANLMKQELGLHKVTKTTKVLASVKMEKTEL